MPNLRISGVLADMQRSRMKEYGWTWWMGVTMVSLDGCRMRSIEFTEIRITFLFTIIIEASHVMCRLVRIY